MSQTWNAGQYVNHASFVAQHGLPVLELLDPTLGEHIIRLDTIPELDSALRLYRRLGFREIPPYRYNPHPDAVFMEYRLE
ncbi:hypothetical protein ACJO2E_05370 [Marinobacter sp. M1N3S26]|uniref:hypothetical protein n=1 Tax=Marinobacter sp. M1N3S26 TaxID=3382299 RepID=UPI00387B1278